MWKRPFNYRSLRTALSQWRSTAPRTIPWLNITQSLTMILMLSSNHPSKSPTIWKYITRTTTILSLLKTAWNKVETKARRFLNNFKITSSESTPSRSSLLPKTRTSNYRLDQKGPRPSKCSSKILMIMNKSWTMTPYMKNLQIHSKNRSSMRIKKSSGNSNESLRNRSNIWTNHFWNLNWTR